MIPAGRRDQLTAGTGQLDPPRAVPATPGRGWAVPFAALAGLSLAVAIVVAWGRRLDSGDDLPGTGTPWLGHWGWTIALSGWYWLLPAAGAGLAILRGWPAACRRLPARWLPAAASATGLLWAAVLAATRGPLALHRPMLHDAEYLAAAGRVGPVGQFLDRYVADLASYPIHVQGHPPGQLLLLWGLDAVGLGGAWPAALQTLVFGAAATGGVLWVAGREAGVDAMRRAAVFVGLTPAVWTMATASDATFSGLCAAAVVLAFAAERSASRSRSRSLAAAAGVVGALCCYFTYAAPLFMAPAILPASRLARQRRWGPVVAAAAGAAVVVVIFTSAGFAWWEGLGATVDAYKAGVASDRPYRYFVLANLVVFAVAAGPAVMVGGLRPLAPGLRPLVLLAAGAVLVADLTGLSKAEVERIWLPFVPWVALAAAPLAATGASARRWLAVQLAVAVVLQLTFRSPW